MNRFAIVGAGIATLVLGTVALSDTGTLSQQTQDISSSPEGLGSGRVVDLEVQAEQENLKTETASEVQRQTSKPIPSSNCHKSYSGCLDPNASDYDCAGGSGNGPKYTGPVQVYGYDEFDLDRDNDGWGCE